jgi:4-amino-4-deoxy-L-arabinose transferase-like glycosyltransferase
MWALLVCMHTYTRAVGWHAPFIDHPLEAFPFAFEALVRALRAVFGAAFVWLAAWQVGAALTSRGSDLFGSRADRTQFTLAIGATGLSSGLVLMALAGVYTPRGAQLALTVCILSRPRAAIREIGAGTAVVWGYLRSATFTLIDTAFATCAAVAIGFALVAALAPEIEYDALWYHLWLPARWLEAGRFVDIVSEYISLYPGGWEVLNGAAMVVGGPVAAKLLHFSCVLQVGAAAVLLGRSIGARAPAVAIVAFCICTPTVIWEGATAYADLSLAWFTTLAAVAVWRFHDTRDRRWIVIGGAVTGGALAIKHLGLVALVPLALGVALSDARRRGARAALRTTVMFGAVALAIAVPWYLRAFAASGNPVFPEMYRVFGARPATRWSDGTAQALEGFKARFGMGRGLEDLVALPWNVTAHAAHFGGSLGPLFLILVPFAVLARERRRLIAMAIGVAAYAAVWASPLGSFQLRFLMPIVAPLAVLGAWGARELSAHAARLHRNLAALPLAGVCLLLILNLPPFMELHDRDRRGWDGWLTHVPGPLPLAVVTGAEAEEAYLARRLPTFLAWRALDAAPINSRVLTFVGGDHYYGRRSRVPAESTLAFPATWGATAGHEFEMLVALKRLGITHVLFDRSPAAQAAVRPLAIASEGTRACCLVPFFEDDRVAVYRVNYPPDDAVRLTADPAAPVHGPTTRAE